MKYYIIAGEASGDLHASNLMKELKLQDPEAEFRCWGGDRMKNQGAELVMHYKDIAYMGFVEVLIHLNEILKNIKFCKKDIESYNPDVVILVDYPGFNLRIAEHVKNLGIKVFYYISPQVWAWKKSRVKKIKAFVDKMFVILPFEKDFYAEFNCDVEFVGHPLLDAIEGRTFKERESFLQENNLPDKKIVALLPGSRKQEIAKMLKMMLSVTPEFKEFQFVIAGVSTIEKSFYQKIIAQSNVSIIFDKTYELLDNAEAALVTSGTATLETALFEVPEIVCYKATYVSYKLAKFFIKVKYISLVNLIMDRLVIKELIQRDLNKITLKNELNRLLFDKVRRAQLEKDYKELKRKLGGVGASKNTAKKMVEILSK
jgi:lipid-A-disaccharide synthase